MAVTKPTPLAEIVIAPQPNAPHVLHITCTSDDAKLWILDQATQYGELGQGARSGQYYLTVSQAFSVQAVRDWLEQGYASE